MLNTTSLPNPNESHYFWSNYALEALHAARKDVEKLYPHRPIETEVHGDYRAKDTFSLRCVDIESELEKGTPARDVLSIVKQWAPVKRTDLHADDIASGTIEYNKEDPNFLGVLIHGDTQRSLTLKAVKRALHQLTKNGPPQDGRVPLSEAMKAALGPLERVDIFERLPENKKKKAPRVVCASNILHYGDLKGQKQFIQNLQETCAEGSRFVVGPAESDFQYLPDMLQRHGFSPEQAANSKIKAQRTGNTVLCKASKNFRVTPLEQMVYVKTER